MSRQQLVFILCACVLNFTTFLCVSAQLYKSNNGSNNIINYMPAYAIASIASGLLNSTQCEKELLNFRDAVDQRILWSLKVLDSSGEFQSDFLYGNNYWTGSRSQCIDTMSTVPLQISKRILLNNTLYRDPQKEIPPFKVNYFAAHFKHNSTLQYHIHLSNEKKMPSCAAPGCRNHQRHGTKMHRFPRDPQRREVWAKNAKIKLPLKDGLLLCEYHFVADMWEKERVDGKRKLKLHAVPTIFGDAVMQMQNNRASEHRSDMESTQHSPIYVYTEPSSKNVVILSECETGHYESAELMQELTHLAPSTEKEIPNNAQQENKEVDAQQQGTSCNIQKAELLTAQKKFTTSDCNCDTMEKYKKLEKLYLKNERLRILMKKNYKRLQANMKRKIMKLEKIKNHLSINPPVGLKLPELNQESTHTIGSKMDFITANRCEKIGQRERCQAFLLLLA